MILCIDEMGAGWRQREQVLFSDVNSSVVFFTSRYSYELKQLAYKEIGRNQMLQMGIFRQASGSVLDILSD